MDSFAIFDICFLVGFAFDVGLSFVVVGHEWHKQLVVACLRVLIFAILLFAKQTFAISHVHQTGWMFHAMWPICCRCRHWWHVRISVLEPNIHQILSRLTVCQVETVILCFSYLIHEYFISMIRCRRAARACMCFCVSDNARTKRAMSSTVNTVIISWKTSKAYNIPYNVVCECFSCAH